MSNKKLSLAAEAYLYGYPLVEGVNEIIKNISGPATVFSGPVNMFAHATKLAGPETDIVSPNNDTLYSFVFADVTKEPLVLHLPDTHDRYYVMQFIDTWTNNFAYLGRRAKGTKEALYLLAGPNWDGEVPDGITLLRSPTKIFVVAGRFACSGEADIPNVKALQQDTWVTPLSLYPARPDNSGRKFGDWELAPYDDRVAGELKFWEQLRTWMKLFPPSEIDQAYQQKFKSLGLLADESPYVNPDPDLVKTLKFGKAECVAFIEANMAPGEPVNGWRAVPHAFDFNLDYLGIGTRSDWVFPDRATAYFFRSIIARVGVWGQHAYEAHYPQIFEDHQGQQLNGASKYVIHFDELPPSDAFWSITMYDMPHYPQIFEDHQGQQLNGASKYVVHFDELPPADAFWSITMYDMPRYRLIDNPINRYSIGDRTPGLKYNPDGSLDICIQHESPGPDKEANWLPTPEGNFRPILRMYQPRLEALDGSYILPPIQKVA